LAEAGDGPQGDGMETGLGEPGALEIGGVPLNNTLDLARKTPPTRKGKKKSRAIPASQHCGCSAGLQRVDR
jgi:hypothetical protein